MSDLGKRVAVAGVGIPVVLGLVYLGGWYLAVPLAAMAALGVHELFLFTAAAGVRPVRGVGAAGAAAFVLLAAWQPTFRAFSPWALALSGGLAVLALMGALFGRGPEGRPLGTAAVTLFGPVYVGLSLSVVPLLHALPATRGWSAPAADPWTGLAVLALPLAATWIGDASAYFAGSAWGRSKLLPSVSPKKSWVGFWAELIGGAAAAGAWLAIARPRLPGLALAPLAVVGLGVLLGLAAVLGDLVESLLKREAGVKDSGSVFPGHGGMLDRLDALIFTMPVAYVALALLGGSR